MHQARNPLRFQEQILDMKIEQYNLSKKRIGKYLPDNTATIELKNACF